MKISVPCEFHPIGMIQWEMGARMMQLGVDNNEPILVEYNDSTTIIMWYLFN